MLALTAERVIAKGSEGSSPSDLRHNRPAGHGRKFSRSVASWLDGKDELPIELSEVHMLEVLGVPLAGNYSDLQRVPALLVKQRLIYLAGRNEYHEWQAAKAKNPSG